MNITYGQRFWTSTWNLGVREECRLWLQVLPFPLSPVPLLLFPTFVPFPPPVALAMQARWFITSYFFCLAVDSDQYSPRQNASVTFLDYQSSNKCHLFLCNKYCYCFGVILEYLWFCKNCCTRRDIIFVYEGGWVSVGLSVFHIPHSIFSTALIFHTPLYTTNNH